MEKKNRLKTYIIIITKNKNKIAYTNLIPINRSSITNNAHYLGKSSRNKSRISS